MRVLLGRAGLIMAMAVILASCSGDDSSTDPEAENENTDELMAAESAREWPAATQLGSGEAAPPLPGSIILTSPGDELFEPPSTMMRIGLEAGDGPGEMIEIDTPPASSASGDFDGDGSTQWILGVPTAASGQGALQLLDATTISDVHTGDSQGQSSLGFLGSTVVVGDFDGDGFDDVAASEPGADGGQGRILVLQGSESGLQSPTQVQFADPSTRYDSLGTALVVADFNDDGFSDLAAGAPGTEIDGLARRGAVLIGFGSAAGLGALTQLAEGLLGAPPRTDDAWIGAALAAGDFDGNGLTDLAAGAPGSQVDAIPGAGSVIVWLALAEGLVPSNEVLHQKLLSGEAEAGDHFGASLAAGDFERNGRAELVVGVPGEAFGRTQSVGMIHVISLSGQGIDGQRTASQATIPGSPEALDFFGAALEVADVDADGFADLLVSTPGEALGDLAHAGLAQLLMGGPQGLTVESDDAPGFLRKDQAADALFGYGLASSWPVSVTTRVQRGRIETVEPGDAGRSVSGWAVISDAAAGASDESYVGLTVDGVRVAEVALTELRLDVARAYPMRGVNVGFEAVVEEDGRVCITVQARELDCWDSP